MTNFIESFYFGELEPQRLSRQAGTSLHKATQVVSNYEELLTQRLNGEEQSLYLQSVNAWDRLMGISNADSFTSGFRLGARFALDTFCTD